MDFTSPDDNVAHLNLESGNEVAIFGSGAGGHSLASARAMNGQGRIHAIDVRKDMLDKLMDNAKMEGFNGMMELHHANIEKDGGTKIGHNSLDAVIIPNTLFSYEDRPGILKEAARITKQGGQLLIVDWKDSFGGMGPSPENVVKEDDAKKLAADAGFELTESYVAGGEHYGLVFKKS